MAKPSDNFTTLLCFFPRQQPATVIPPFIVPATCTMQPSSTNIWQASQARRLPVAWGKALVHCILESYTFCAAHPTPSFIPPPLNPYNRLLAEVLMERDDDLEDVEMEDRETKDGGGGTFMMNRAAPEALLKFLLLSTPPLPSFLLLSAPTTDC